MISGLSMNFFCWVYDAKMDRKLVQAIPQTMHTHALYPQAHSLIPRSCQCIAQVISILIMSFGGGIHQMRRAP